MFLTNGTVLNADFQFEKLDLEIEAGKITRIEREIRYQEDELVIDCEGFYITPGFVDIHIHGTAGFDCNDGTREAVEGMAKFLITKGVTSFCPTTMTLPEESIMQAVEAIADCMTRPCEGARVAGVNLEGPFISTEKKGRTK